MRGLLKLSLVALVVLSMSARSVEQSERSVGLSIQCRADQQRWLTLVRSSSSMKHSTGLPPLGVVRQWQEEMEACEQIDRQGRFDYYAADSELEAELLSRAENFLERHDLLKQFIEEDEAGGR